MYQYIQQLLKFIFCIDVQLIITLCVSFFIINNLFIANFELLLQQNVYYE